MSTLSEATNIPLPIQNPTCVLPTEGVLEEPGELALPVGDVCVEPLALLAQGGDDVAEGEEAEVNVDPLLQPVPFRVGLLLPLRPGQVHHVKLGNIGTE